MLVGLHGHRIACAATALCGGGCGAGAVAIGDHVVAACRVCGGGVDVDIDIAIVVCAASGGAVRAELVLSDDVLELIAERIAEREQDALHEAVGAVLEPEAELVRLHLEVLVLRHGLLELEPEELDVLGVHVVEQRLGYELMRQVADDGMHARLHVDELAVEVVARHELVLCGHLVLGAPLHLTVRDQIVQRRIRRAPAASAASTAATATTTRNATARCRSSMSVARLAVGLGLCREHARATCAAATYIAIGFALSVY